MSLIWVLVGVGAITPILVALAIIFFGTHNVPGSGRIVRPTLIGIVLGALGGLLVCALVIALALGLRELR